VTATVTWAGTCTGRTKNGATYHYACFTAGSPDGETFGDLHGRATIGGSVRISYAVDFPFRCSLGETLSPDIFSATFMGFGLFMLALTRLPRDRDERRWFDVEPFESEEPR
jgi:hypothetical protein